MSLLASGFVYDLQDYVRWGMLSPLDSTYPKKPTVLISQPLLPSCEGVLANLSDLLLSLLCGLPGKSYLFLCFTCHLYLKMITHKSLLPAKILHLSFRPNHLTAYQIFPLVLLIKCIQNQILHLAPKPTLTSPYSSAQWMASLATLLAKSEAGIQPRNLSSYLPHMKSHPFCVSL